MYRRARSEAAGGGLGYEQRVLRLAGAMFPTAGTAYGQGKLLAVVGPLPPPVADWVVGWPPACGDQARLLRRSAPKIRPPTKSAFKKNPLGQVFFVRPRIVSRS